ncbi:4'-phosphopantetheinyl transferase superfamily protein [Streptomyces venezuelae]|uniref:4'-phosphopantetheinyl transferase family protein n=1 Tax=Streptomyces venezuelae TaxID=54571 RepID=UPI001239BC98|nr:4'-phosphopantetheinyl transferase superfamily protein [Streptomyces venezuelae]QES09346.1 4'-phosphopantetheinyl transferase superfamily protein [Streptomyces venezuelae]
MASDEESARGRRHGPDREPKRPADREPDRAADVVRVLGERGEAHVWWWTAPECTDPEDLPLLDTEEFRRALAIPAERDAAAFVRSRAVVRRALGELFGLDPRDLALGRRACPGCADTGHGPPRLVVPGVPLVLSVSRTAGHGLLALGAGASIGVDAEALRPVTDRRFADPDLTPGERRHLRGLPPGPDRDRAYLRIWTRKEAVAKATGLGLSGTALGRLDTRPADRGPVRIATWTVEDLHLVEGIVAALARPEGPAGHGPVHHHAYGDDRT